MFELEIIISLGIYLLIRSRQSTLSNQYFIEFFELASLFEIQSVQVMQFKLVAK